MPWSALAGLAGSAISGVLGSSATAKSNKVQQQMAAANIENQRLFAKKGIRWRVDDAKKAGIHPLYALGANTHSFSPVNVGHTPDMSMANAAANMGQDLSRAIDATRTRGERLSAFDQSVQQLSLQKMGLENELLGAQIAKIKQSSAPAFPSTVPSSSPLAGQGDALIDDQPLERVIAAPGRPQTEPGAVSEVGYLHTNHGRFPTMSKDAKERLEEDWPGMLMWNLRNRVLPTIGLNQTPPPASELPPGYDAWIYNPFRQEYTPHKRSRFGIYY